LILSEIIPTDELQAWFVVAHVVPLPLTAGFQHWYLVNSMIITPARWRDPGAA
jgi:hypothetical protein